jgi:hypothetical protein
LSPASAQNTGIQGKSNPGRAATTGSETPREPRRFRPRDLGVLLRGTIPPAGVRALHLRVL